MAALGKAFVVRLDLARVIKIVHHQPMRLLQPVGRDIAQMVQTFKPRAIAQMEPRHRIDHALAPVAGAQEIAGGGGQQRRAQLFGGGWVPAPIGPVQRGAVAQP